MASPSQIVEAGWKLWQAGVLQQHIYVSAAEFVIGYGVSAIVGIPLGLALAVSPRGRAILSPWVDGLYATPIIAIAPLVILWFGIGIASKVFVVFSVVVFPIIINTEAGIKGTPTQLIDAIRCFGATDTQIFRKVMLPAALPYIFAGLRLGIGRGLIGVVVGELFGAREGLGRLISDSAESFNMPNLFVGVMLLAVAGVGFTALFRAYERRIIHWT